jgi:hypothetical protein
MILTGISVYSCGQDERIGQEGFSLNFSTRDIPAEAESIDYFVLSSVEDNTSTRCYNLIGEYATTNIDSIDLGSFEEIGNTLVESDDVSIVISDLPEGFFVFFLRVLDGVPDDGTVDNAIGCGCGEGTIVKGKKIIIPIRITTECFTE